MRQGLHYLFLLDEATHKLEGENQTEARTEKETGEWRTTPHAVRERERSPIAKTGEDTESPYVEHISREDTEYRDQ